MKVVFEDIVEALYKRIDQLIAQKQLAIREHLAERPKGDSQYFGSAVHSLCQKIEEVNEIGSFLAKEFRGTYKKYSTAPLAKDMWKNYENRFGVVKGD